MATYQKVIVHPLVLLSVTDHFDRSGKTARKRVLGTLLGTRLDDDTVEVTNCYGVPFEEDRKDKSVWFVDYRYHERMNKMFSKVNGEYKIFHFLIFCF